MRKRELVHLHALFDRVRRFMRDQQDLEEGQLAAYRHLDVGPTEVYRSKGDHEKAVTTLARSLADVTGRTDAESGSEGPPASARSD